MGRKQSWCPRCHGSIRIECANLAYMRSTMGMDEDQIELLGCSRLYRAVCSCTTGGYARTKKDAYEDLRQIRWEAIQECAKLRNVTLRLAQRYAFKDWRFHHLTTAMLRRHMRDWPQDKSDRALGGITSTTFQNLDRAMAEYHRIRCWLRQYPETHYEGWLTGVKDKVFKKYHNLWVWPGPMLEHISQTLPDYLDTIIRLHRLDVSIKAKIKKARKARAKMAKAQRKARRKCTACTA